MICLTEYGRQRLLHHYPELERKCIVVIPHGVDHEAFYPRKPDDTFETARRYGIEQSFFLQLGSWLPHKNLELSVRAFARCRARRRGMQLVFAGGGGKSDYRARIEDLSRQQGVSDVIKWLDHVESEDLASFVAASSCMLQPSLYEGFALPVLEAMASGVPGVVSDSSCLPEVSAGIWPVAPGDDPESFAKGMDQMSLDGDAGNLPSAPV